jgi:LacI family transcriptional regulator
MRRNEKTQPENQLLPARRFGKGRVTMKDVAAHAGVSRATVSLVVRDSPQIPTETKDRVRQSMEQLGYVYDHRAAVMRAERTMTMGLVATDVRNPYFAELTMALQTRLHEAGFALITGYSLDDKPREDRLLEVMVQRHVDGVFVIPSKSTTSDDLNRWLLTSGTPHVLIARRIRDHEADYVAADNVRAGVLLGEHLATEGCRTVSFLGGPPQSPVRTDRERGLVKSLKAHGIGLDHALSIASSADRAGGVEAVNELLSNGTLPDAIACYNDVVAFGVMEALRRHGFQPGADVSVGSFDDISEAEQTHPPLTSVATFPEQVGYEAARILIERLDDPDAASQRVLLSPRLSVRESTTTRRRATISTEANP